MRKLVEFRVDARPLELVTDLVEIALELGCRGIETGAVPRDPVRVECFADGDDRERLVVRLFPSDDLLIRLAAGLLEEVKKQRAELECARVSRSNRIDTPKIEQISGEGSMWFTTMRAPESGQ